MSNYVEKNSKDLVAYKRKLIEELPFTSSDLEEIIDIISYPNPNNGIIDKALMPPLILPVVVTRSEKMIIIPPSVEYPMRDAKEIHDHKGWRSISSQLSESDTVDFISGVKLGNGTAWEQGLQIHGEKSSPDWSNLAQYFSKYSVSDPNYPKSYPPIPIIPSIIYPPPSLRRAFATYTGDNYTGSPLELLVARRHEESHVIEMIVQPWPAGADSIDGFGENGAHKFINMLNNYGVNLQLSSELQPLLELILDPKILPRSYLGEFQAYLGDFIFLKKHLGIDDETLKNLIEAEKIRAKTLWKIKPQRLPKNYFGMVAAFEIIRTIPIDQSILLLNEVFSLMKL